MLELVIFLLIVIGAAFYGIGPLSWSLLFGLSLLYYSYFTTPAIIGLLLLWPLFIGLVLFLNFTTLRRRYISTHIVKWARNVLPEISDTEREALEAGTVSWDGELFSGNPQDKATFKAPSNPGAYRLFISVKDGNKHTAHANIPFWVEE